MTIARTYCVTPTKTGYIRVHNKMNLTIFREYLLRKKHPNKARERMPTDAEKSSYKLNITRATEKVIEKIIR